LDCVFDEKVWVSLFVLFRERMKEKITQRKRERERERERRLRDERERINETR